MSLKKISNALKKHRRFLISTHVNADPDALCSEMALAEALKARGKQVMIINNEAVARRYLFLPGLRRIRVYRQHAKLDYDCAIIVDCGEIERIGRVQKLLREGKPVINIDHHITNNNFGDINLVNAEASSTCEILYGLIKLMNVRIDKKIAVHLYSGIMTDTGSFRYENTTSRTHLITAELLQHKVSPAELYGKLYESIPYKDLKAFTQVIRGFNAISTGRIAVVELRKSILKKFSKDFDLRDTIFKFLRSIKEIEALVILTEMSEDTTRVNLRSSSKVNVARIAHQFNGGGHKRASGCIIGKNIKESRKDILKQIKKAL